MATTYVRLDSGVEISTSDPATVAVVYRLINTQVDDGDLDFLEPSRPWVDQGSSHIPAAAL